MFGISRVIILLFSFIFVESQIFLHHANDALGMEQFDCVFVQSTLWYCRRPKETVDSVREENWENQSCANNGGEIHLYSELRSKNISINTVQYEWVATLGQVEEYSLYLSDLRLLDGHLCRCLQVGTFGMNCEYQLPTGKTFEETLQWQLIMREKNQQAVQVYGDVVCYETLECNSGVLCLDWREICDGVQHCMSGLDEENCDLLEINRCDPEDEYRCMNGMCIPDQFFLDGQFDCLDWSDEMPYKNSKVCPSQSVNTECDDHLWPLKQWSCGDGQYIDNRLNFQKSAVGTTCGSGRDQYFICETHPREKQWTMPNGRCYRGGGYEASPVTNRSDEEQCEYLLKCALSAGGEIGCPCNGNSECAEKLGQLCRWLHMRYPHGAVLTPSTFFFYDGARHWQNSLPESILINGTIPCRGLQINVTNRWIRFALDLDVHETVEDHFCQPFLSNISSSEYPHNYQQCHHANESTDRCDKWNRCLSITRINDGWRNCLNERDEVPQTEVESELSCAHVRRHRFHCSADQPTCMSVTRLGDRLPHCHNGFDELWMGVGRTLRSMNYNDRRQDECSLLRQYIDQSWKLAKRNEEHSKLQIPFRSYCDTFWNLETREDEDLEECQQWWICSYDQARCQRGQCIEKRWISDHEWDCADALDEYHYLKERAEWAFLGASGHNFHNRSYFVPQTCNQSDSFLCLSSEATRQGFSCFNLSQIGDGHIDCAGAMDEQNTIKRCSQSSMLGDHFQCLSTNTCIPYLAHCLQNYRCQNRSDDQYWCDRQHSSSDCRNLKDFICFDGRCVKQGRCNRHFDCSFGEEEYMCDYHSTYFETLVPHRRPKRFAQGTKPNALLFSAYPADSNITQHDSHSITTVPPSTIDNSTTSSSLSPYWCNRALGVLISATDSIICFCPPQYYGEKCEHHADRLSVLLHLDLSQSTYYSTHDSKILLKILVLFIYNDEILQRDQFHLHPFSQTITTLTRKKFISHFLYPRSSFDLQQRRERFFNRSDLRLRHPYSIRIELYQAPLKEEPLLMGVWNFALNLDHLPVTRLAKVLRLTSSVGQRQNPCSSYPCHPNERCHPLMNDKSNFICLCPTNFTGPNCFIRDSQCDEGYCLEGSLCQPYSRSSSPFCLCPSNRYGRRCSIEHNLCLLKPCLNNGSCFPDYQPDQVICLCTKEYAGSECQWKRPLIHLSLSTDLAYAGAVVQFFDIDSFSLEIISLHQQVFKTLPQHIEYYHQQDRQQTTITGIVLAKLYSSDEDQLLPNIHLLALYVDVFSLHVTTEISPINLCAHLQTFTNESSPIRYHQICRKNWHLLCFRDDIHLCLCTENHTRVECFLYNDELDRCSHCLAKGRCLKGDLRQSKDFLCLCASCHSGKLCQFNTKSFSFTLDQLFSADLLSAQRQRATISLLIFSSLFIFFFALPNNLFSFLTFRRSSCLRYGCGHYLLWMSVINQLSLALLIVRLLHLIMNITGTSSFPSRTNDLLCKSLNYLLSSSTRLVYWLTSLIAIERVYTTIFLRGQWLKQPRIARRLMAFIFFAVFVTDLYELFFYESFSGGLGNHGSLCILQISPRDRSLWITLHLLFLILHSLLPLLINLVSTLTISLVVIKKKINTHPVDQAGKSIWMNIRARFYLIVDVLSENKEIVLGPAITLVPQLFSLPLFISSFILDCRNLEDSWLRHFLIVSYWISFTPQWTSFFLYVVPSSLYTQEWRQTSLGRWLNNHRRRHASALPSTTFTSLSIARDMRKDKH